MPKKKETPVEIPEEQSDTTVDLAESEIDPQVLVAASERRDRRMREADAELESLEDRAAAARQEANSYKKPIAEARIKLRRLISTDVHGFLKMEEEERKENELPLIDAWRKWSVEKLDLPEKDKEKILAAGFETCGELSDWLSKDWPEKKQGLGGEKTKDRIRDALNKISGGENVIADQLEANGELTFEESVEEMKAGKRCYPVNADWIEGEYFFFDKTWEVFDGETRETISCTFDDVKHWETNQWKVFDAA